MNPLSSRHYPLKSVWDATLCYCGYGDNTGRQMVTVESVDFVENRIEIEGERPERGSVSGVCPGENHLIEMCYKTRKYVTIYSYIIV